MEAASKARIQGLVNALCGLLVVTAGYLAGRNEIHSGPGPYPMLMLYWLLFPIGGHLFFEGLNDAMSREFRDNMRERSWFFRD